MLSAAPTGPEAPEPEALVHRFQQDGYVVLEDCLGDELLAELRDSFAALMQAKVARTGIRPVRGKDPRQSGNERVKIDFDPQGGNHDLNRWNMHLPSTPLFLREELVAHPRLMPLLDALLGPGQVLFIMASDTPYPGSGFQNIHQDFPRFGLTVNIPLVDFTDDNAPLEVWPGSHLRSTDRRTTAFHTGSVNLSRREIDELRQRTPGRRLLVKAGSILVRDQRLVHRGTANVGNRPRPCLSLWYKSHAGALRPLALDIPVPHRAVADQAAQLAWRMREAGRGHEDNRQNKALVNLGSLLGRLVEEFSASDRDHRRIVPAALFDALPARARHLLRHARTSHAASGGAGVVHGRSFIGSALLALVAGVFLLLGVGAYCFAPRGGHTRPHDDEPP